jgi:hypothetical protein
MIPLGLAEPYPLGRPPEEPYKPAVGIRGYTNVNR